MNNQATAKKAETTTTLATAPKKLTVNQLKLGEGDHVDGKFVGRSQSAPFQEVDSKSGEVVTKQITFVILETADGRVKLAQDAGLKSALDDAMVKEGDKIRVQKLAKIGLKGGRSMNQYDIFAL